MPNEGMCLCVPLCGYMCSMCRRIEGESPFQDVARIHTDGCRCDPSRGYMCFTCRRNDAIEADGREPQQVPSWRRADGEVMLMAAEELTNSRERRGIRRSLGPVRVRWTEPGGEFPEQQPMTASEILAGHGEPWPPAEQLVSMPSPYPPPVPPELQVRQGQLPHPPRLLPRGISLDDDIDGYIYTVFNGQKVKLSLDNDHRRGISLWCQTERGSYRKTLFSLLVGERVNSDNRTNCLEFYRHRGVFVDAPFGLKLSSCETRGRQVIFERKE